MRLATLPALSLSLTVKRARRPSAAKPLSRQRPRTVVSIFPPHSTTTTLGDANRIKGSLNNSNIKFNVNSMKDVEWIKLRDPQRIDHKIINRKLRGHLITKRLGGGSLDNKVDSDVI